MEFYNDGLEDQENPLDAMRRGVEYRFPVKVRRKVIMMRPLSIDEHAKITAETVEQLAMLPSTQKTSMKEHLIYTAALIERASTSDTQGKDPRLTEMLVNEMTPEEVQHIYQQWLDGCKLCDPALEHLTKDRVEDLVAGIKKNPSTLTALSSWEVMELCRSLLGIPAI